MFSRSIFVCVAFVCSLASHQAFSQPTSPKPNVLLIVSDDQGWPDLGCMGIRDIQTPNLDRLAADGVRAANFYVTWPACTPSRGSILTGRHPLRNGLYDMIRNDEVNYGHRFTAQEYSVSPEMTLGLDVRESTIGDLLKGNGYRCGVVGKWDMGQARRFLPLQRGFDFFYGHGNNGIDYYTHERYGVPSLFSGNARTEADKGTYATDLFQREAIRFIDGASEKRPWFLYLCFNAPHGASSFADGEAKEGKTKTSGVQAPDEFVKPYLERGVPEQVARYLGAVTKMDAAIGEVLASLERRGEIDNTLVMFLSDNGGSGNGGNAPLRGKKSQLWEGGLRVPFIASFPGRLPAGMTTDAMLTSLEILPTILSATQTTTPNGLKLDGFNMLPTLAREQPSPRKTMFWEFRGESVVRDGEWKWIGRSKRDELYHLGDDPSESKDMSKADPERVQAMKSLWKAWRNEMEDAEPRGPFRDY